MKIITYKVTVLGIILATFLSCSRAKLDSINKNPNQPEDVPISVILPQAIVSTIHGVAGDGAGEYASLFAEHVTNVHPPDRHPYDIKETVWARVYSTLEDLSQIIEKGNDGGEEQGHYVEVGIAKILFAYTLNIGTDLYGDIPYSEALKGSENRMPRFDSQESIYIELQGLLDEALTFLNRGTIGNLSSIDLIYQGDVNMWKKVAYAMKARFYNRLSNIDPQGSARNAIDNLHKSFTNQSESFTFNDYQNGLTNANPWANWQQTENTYGACTTMLDVLNKYMPIQDDPRANMFFTKINGSILGGAPGQSLNDLSHTIFSAPSPQNVLSDDASQPLITYDELKFIEAEAYLRLGKTDSAYLAYSVAVESACRRVGIEEDDIDNYLNRHQVMPGENGLTLENIIEQKYLSFFMFQSIEAFNDMRRTGIPKAHHPSGLVLRLSYPDSEISRNNNTPDDINDVTVYNIPIWWGEQ